MRWEHKLSQLERKLHEEGYLDRQMDSNKRRQDEKEEGFEEFMDPPIKKIRVVKTPEEEIKEAETKLEEQDEEEQENGHQKKSDGPVTDELYLETIDRSRLDFDFEKLCSISLSNINVYACLVCGKYLQGRGKSSYAYFHSVDEDHHVFINLQTLKVYVLPEMYEVTSPALNDIKYVVNPTYTSSDVAELDKIPAMSFDLQHLPYRPGFIGMNNIKCNGYLNVVIEALAHVEQFRNYMMLQDLSHTPTLVQRTSVLIRKLWNPKAFRSHVSPHELLQQVSAQSNKRFKLTEPADAFDFLNWFLNNLHLALGGSRTKSGSSIIHKIFQGRLQIERQKITAKADSEDRLRFEVDTHIDSRQVPFLFLSLDLPPAPLFQDETGQNIIPQVMLLSLLSKYDGKKTKEMAGDRLRFKITKLPRYLIFVIKRFTKNNFVEEKNPTIVNFPLTNLDMSPYTQGATSPIFYNLVANIVHESQSGEAGGGGGEENTKSRRRQAAAAPTAAGSSGRVVWRVQLHDKARDEWVQIEDLFVDIIRREMLFLSESYIQIWERRE